MKKTLILGISILYLMFCSTVSMAKTVDFNNDGIDDILWRKGNVNHLWYMSSDGSHTYKNIGTKSTSYTIAGLGDFNGDGITDILWRKGYSNYLWYMNADGSHTYKKISSKSYKLVTVKDFNNDGIDDILWRKDNSNHIWYMSADGNHTYKNIGTKSTTYSIAAVSDFNGDDIADILWRKGDKNYLWYMNSNGSHSYKKITSKSYKVVSTADFNNDGIDDILWRKGNSNNIWYMNADGSYTYKDIGTKSTSYSIGAIRDFNGDGVTDILWRKGDKNYLWYMNSDGGHSYKKISSKSYIVVGPNDKPKIIDNKFTTEWLSAKTLYNTYKDCDDSGNNCSWEIGVFDFTINRMNGYVLSTPNENINVEYIIDSKGYIEFFDTEENETKNIRILETKDDFIRLQWTDKWRELRTDIYEEFFYFDLEKAKDFIDKNNQILLIPSQTINSINDWNSVETIFDDKNDSVDIVYSGLNIKNVKMTQDDNYLYIGLERTGLTFPSSNEYYNYWVYLEADDGTGISLENFNAFGNNEYRIYSNISDYNDLNLFNESITSSNTGDSILEMKIPKSLLNNSTYTVGIFSHYTESNIFGDNGEIQVDNTFNIKLNSED